eukprot:1669229-Amphidinium_carterae.1
MFLAHLLGCTLGHEYEFGSFGSYFGSSMSTFQYQVSTHVTLNFLAAAAAAAAARWSCFCFYFN